MNTTIDSFTRVPPMRDGAFCVWLAKHGAIYTPMMTSDTLTWHSSDERPVAIMTAAGADLYLRSDLV